MEPTSIFRARVTAAITALPENTPEARQAVYHKAREYLTFSKFAHLTTDLESAIDDIEASYAPVKERATADPPSWKRLRYVVAAAAVLVLIVAAGIIGRIVLPGAPDTEFDRGFDDYSPSARGYESVPPWSTYYAAGRDGDVAFVEANGTAPLYSKRAYPVTEGKSYKVSTRIRTTKDDPDNKGSRAWVGVVAYDANDEPIGPGIAPAIFPAMRRLLISAEMGWTTGEGIVVWQGGDANTTLPKGTRSVRLVARLNEATPKATSQIDYLRFQEVAPGAPK